MKQTVTVKTKKEVEVCERCEKAKAEDALPLTLECYLLADKRVETVVCESCAQTIFNSLTMARRKPQAKSGKTKAAKASA